MKFGKSHAVGVAVAGIAAVLATTSPATATVSSSDSPLLSTSRGNARFYNVGDKVTVCDTLADGHAADATLFDDRGYYLLGVRAASLGECNTASVNIPEGTSVRLTLSFNNTDDYIAGPEGWGVA